MPPKRATRAATSSSRLFDGSSEAGGPIGSNSPLQPTVAARGMSPGPAKFSSSYGSPATIAPTRQNVARQRYNFATALDHVINAVEKDNQSDARHNELREAEEQGLDTTDLKAQVEREEAEARKQQEEEEARQEREQEDARQQRETSTSVDLVKEPTARRKTTRKRHARTASGQSSVASSRQASEAPPNNLFAEADSVFAETEIFTPVVPSRTTSGGGVVSRTSNILHNLLNSARRISTVHEDPQEEAIRQAYPNMTFINPRPDNGPVETASAAEAAATSGSTAVEEPPEPESQPAPGNRRSKAVKSRVATPGPSRVRKSQRKDPDTSIDELANNSAELTTADVGQGPFGTRRQPRRRVAVVAPEEPQASSQPATEPAPSADANGHLPSGTFGRVWSSVLTIGEATKALAMAITVLTLSLILVRAFVITTSTPELYKGYRVDNRLQWYGSDWRSNLRQLVPFALIHPLGAISDEEFARVNGLILSHANEIAQLRHSDRLHGDAVEKINHILPAVVHMDLDKRGQPIISQDFWHALKDRVLADKDIFTLLKNKDGSLSVSDLQWAALKHRLEASGMVPDASTKALSVRDVEGIAETTLAKSWEAWLHKNQKKVKDILGVAPPAQPQPGGGDALDRLTDVQLAKLARQMSVSDKVREIIVSRQEFMQHLQNSFVEHRLEIKGELSELEARVIEAAKSVAAAAAAINNPAQSSPLASGGPVDATTKKEIMHIVDQYFRKHVRDTQIEAMTRGNIKANWNTNLIHNVNFFSRNMGAIFNHHFSSPAYTPTFSYGGTSSVFWFGKNNRNSRNRKKSKAATSSMREVDGDGADGDSNSRHGGVIRPVPGSMRGSVVFEQWEEDGDCWCAAADPAKGKKGQPEFEPTDLAVKLGVPIVPENLVIEHISLSATLDPGAMPKDLEVWAQIADYKQQRTLLDWSMGRFPETDPRHPLFGWGFVKLGEFEFVPGSGSGSRKGERQNSVHVFRMPPELAAMDAVTDHVLVRALSNQGNKDHTCFYRVRMYGEPQLD